MKRFEFNLDGLLRVKRQLEHLAELEQLKAQQAVLDARARVVELRGQQTELSDALTATVGRVMPANRWATAFEMIERVGQQIEAAERAHQAAERKLADASQERVQVSTEVEALRTLRQQQWDKWRQEAAQADQENLDELGLRRWMAARAAHTGAA